MLLEEREGEEAGVTLVHVVGVDVRQPERPQHATPPMPRIDFLAEAVALVAAVQRVGESAVVLVVSLDISCP